MRIRLLMVVLLALLADSALAKPREPATLYQRLGSYDGVVAIADDYLKLMRADPAFARFKGRGADTLRRAKQFLHEQLCAITGGPCTYVGRDMKTIHGGLGITEQEWAASNRHFESALEKNRVPAREKKEFQALIDALKSDIVE